MVLGVLSLVYNAFRIPIETEGRLCIKKTLAFRNSKNNFRKDPLPIIFARLTSWFCAVSNF